VSRPTGIVALAVASAIGCRSQTQLGDPDAASATPSSTQTTSVPPRCSGVPSRAIVTVAEDSWGELRAIVVGGGALYALFARAATNAGALARVPTSGGRLTEVANVGVDPAALALASDSSFVFVSARASSQVFRVDSLGGVVTGAAGGVPSALVADDHAGAFWTLPASDTIVGWDFAFGAPKAIATTSRPSALLRVAKTLYVVGSGSISAFEPGRDGAPRKIADRCDAGAPAVDGQTLYCADAGAIARVDLATGAGAVVAEAQPGASDVVLGAGRLFWRAAPSPRQTLVMALPLDGIGGPTVIEGLAPSPGPLLIASEGCDLYFTAGRTIVRRGF
jgi:hypothetical protein